MGCSWGRIRRRPRICVALTCIVINMKRAVLIFILSFTATVPPAEAVKLWKWVDEEGKVTYSESRPPSKATKAKQKQINPDQNVIKSEVPVSAPASSPSRAANNTNQRQAKQPMQDVQKGIAAGGGAAPPPPVPAVPPPAAAPAPPAAPAVPAAPAAPAAPAPVAH